MEPKGWDGMGGILRMDGWMDGWMDKGYDTYYILFSSFLFRRRPPFFSCLLGMVALRIIAFKPLGVSSSLVVLRVGPIHHLNFMFGCAASSSTHIEGLTDMREHIASVWGFVVAAAVI
jgi:hypothetical protein